MTSSIPKNTPPTQPPKKKENKPKEVPKVTCHVCNKVDSIGMIALSHLNFCSQSCIAQYIANISHNVRMKKQ